MKKIIPTLTLVLAFLIAPLLILSTPVSAAPPDSWTTRAPMQQARSTLGVAAVNGKIYAIGGSIASGWAPSIPPSAAYGDINLGGFVGTNEEYDPATNTWTYRALMPTPRMAFATAVYENKIYCIGGRSVAGDLNGGYTSVNEVYNVETDTWETKASLPVAAGWLKAGVVAGKVYVLTSSGTNYAYDPTNNSWATKASVPFSAFNSYAIAVLEGRMHVIGGLSPDQHGNLHSVYDPETDKWISAASPPSSHSGGAAGATIGAMAPKRVYVFGEPANLKQGENPGFVRAYGPKTDSWEYGADSPTSRYNFGVAVLNETFYVIGGHTYSFPGNFAPSKINEQYIPIDYGNPDTEPLELSMLSPENKTYNSSSIPLSFSINKPSSKIEYSLDGKSNVTISGNITLTELPNGYHNVTVYATDEAGNIGVSETVFFTVNAPEPFPIVPVAIAVVLVTSAGLLVYLKKRGRKPEVKI